MAKKKNAKAKPPELRVVFDTNAIYSGSASDLIKQEVTELMKEGDQHPDLSVKWYLPETALHERQYQMQSRAFELFPSIKKLEMLLGHNLGITEEIIKTRVREAA